MISDNPANEQKDTLKSFLKDEIDGLNGRLSELIVKERIKREDFNSLQADLYEKKTALESLKDNDDSQLILLSREIASLKSAIEALAVQRGWSRIPASAKIMICILPVMLYFLWLSMIQWNNRDHIYDYPATQTASVIAQTAAALSTTEISVRETSMPPLLTPAP